VGQRRRPRAWEEILHRYDKFITATVRSFRLQPGDALDAVQMTWLQLAENTHRIHSPERLAGWLASTARRACLHILRQAKRASGSSGPIEVADPSMSPAQRAINADTAHTLWTLVEELSPRQRTLLRALFTDPRPYTEIARTTGIPPGGIEPTRARALAQLQSRLEQHQSMTGSPRNHDARSTEAAGPQRSQLDSVRHRCVDGGPTLAGGCPGRRGI
jgi:RNA polymerase sigma factor (sigma-70 family)